MVSPELGACTVSLGTCKYHPLEEKLRTCAAKGLKIIDFFEPDWLEYLSKQPGVNMNDPYDPIPAHLEPARRIGDLCKSLGLRIICFQYLSDIEGLLDETERKAVKKRVTSTFPFLRAFQTNLVYLTSNRRTDDRVTFDLRYIAKDLALFGDWAREFAEKDGGDQIMIGYEPLSWGTKVNRWNVAWEAVRLANHPNVGIVLDTFNILAVEYANPYNQDGHGRIYATEEEAIAHVRKTMADLAHTIDGDKIVMFQIADGQKVDSKTFLPPQDPTVPPLLPWSRNHRLYPMEQEKGGYMPVVDVTAAVLSTGYEGPLTVEVFNKTLLEPGDDVIDVHATRAINGLRKLVKEVNALTPFW